nr:bifunctional proline dehydrogenase/L-glutamate gamma-semialdehyde dehydrogenase PutA [Gammaproteobacteria bacterium]
MADSKPPSTDALRQAIRDHYLCDESVAVRHLLKQSSLTPTSRNAIGLLAENFVQAVRDSSDPAILESFLAEYGLSSEEGVALMCLAEALLRVPDAATVDALIHDKIVPADWGRHLGASSSSMVNASTWALMLTGKLISDKPEGLVGTLRNALKRLGEPVVRTAVGQAIRELGSQFVLGEDISSAVEASADSVAAGYTYSYDMLGEAARTDADAKRYHLAYSEAISSLGAHCTHATVARNPGISVKLSALYPRYEQAKRDDVLVELVARTRSLAMLAKSANMGFNIDAEEADRLDLSLDVIETVLAEPSLAGWNGFGIVVQAYSPRAWFVLDWLYDMADRLDRNIMVRLVKGAYWDSEIKRAQVLGLEGFPVFTRKCNTDISYITCAEKLLGMKDRIYPQFATHNAHSVAAILSMAENPDDFEFQRLHGMGEALHQHILKTQQTRCRIYAPVGAHVDLLAYLVRRLLENGANSSFVNQIVDESVTAAEIAADPFSEIEPGNTSLSHPGIRQPADLYAPERRNSKGWDLTDPLTINELERQRQPFKHSQWHATPLIAGSSSDASEQSAVLTNPANHSDTVGSVRYTTPAEIELAFSAAAKAGTAWRALDVTERARLLECTSDLLEKNAPELLSLATREAGKTLADGVAEIREAVDFLRYYGAQACTLQEPSSQAEGPFICISPWNFPLAIFCGQIAAALVTGNTVIAKPADQSPLIAWRTIQLFHLAGVPADVLQLLPGSGSTVGAALVADERIAGVCFTGSTATAQHIHKNMAQRAHPAAPLIAETGGLNAMIVDSTALPEQAVSDILVSAFQSAGQRCSALRVLFVQSDIAPQLTNMLIGAMDALSIGDPWELNTDVGPVIDAAARDKIAQHCDTFAERGRLLHSLATNATLQQGFYISPAVIRLNDIAELQEEIFGPVLHIIEYEADSFKQVLDAINNTGYALTFGLHSRVDERVQDAVDGIMAGNLYINRNQIGAIVGSQPFGGKGLSGTGPKAGGPHYLQRFIVDLQSRTATSDAVQTIASSDIIDQQLVQEIADQLADASFPTEDVSAHFMTLDCPEFDLSPVVSALEVVDRQHHTTIDLPGPTGESNRLGMLPAGTFIIVHGGNTPDWLAAIVQCLAVGNPVIAIHLNSDDLTVLPDTIEQWLQHYPVAILNGMLEADSLKSVASIAGVNCPGCKPSFQPQLREYRQALSNRDGAILPLLTGTADLSPLIHETALCIDTTAAGGNATLL